MYFEPIYVLWALNRGTCIEIKEKKIPFSTFNRLDDMSLYRVTVGRLHLCLTLIVDICFISYYF